MKLQINDLTINVAYEETAFEFHAAEESVHIFTRADSQGIALSIDELRHLRYLCDRVISEADYWRKLSLLKKGL